MKFYPWGRKLCLDKRIWSSVKNMLVMRGVQVGETLTSHNLEPFGAFWWLTSCDPSSTVDRLNRFSHFAIDGFVLKRGTRLIQWLRGEYGIYARLDYKHVFFFVNTDSYQEHQLDIRVTKPWPFIHLLYNTHILESIKFSFISIGLIKFWHHPCFYCTLNFNIPN